MKNKFLAYLAILLSAGLYSLGSGLQGTALGVRATIEGFSTAITGVVMSGFSVGYLLGSIYVPKYVQKVGHIRVFGAFSAIASAAILFHSIIVHPAMWIPFRLISGICAAGIAIVIESWLNNSATNQTRGKVLATYMVVSMAASAGGQLLLNLGSPEGFIPFIIVSVLMSVAAVPILLTAVSAPSCETPQYINIKELYRISPLGVMGTLAVSVAQGALTGMGMVYAKSIGLTMFQISLFMTTLILGGALFQWPAGLLSDRFDRRRVIVILTFAACFIAFIAVIFSNYSQNLLFVLVFLLGGCCLPLYSLSIAQTNDHLEPNQIVAASSGLILVGGVGIIIGPIGVGVFMQLIGPTGYFIFLALVHGSLGAFGLYRMKKSKSVPNEEQKIAINLPVRTTPIVVNLIPEKS